MDAEKKRTLISLSVHAAAGAGLGLLSPFLGRALYALGAAIIIAVILEKVTVRMTGKRDLGWWAGNGLFVYIFVWLDVWILFFNYF